jgi:hypothetical protein
MTDGALSNYGAKTVTTSAQLIAGARSSREQIAVQNLHATNLLYIGPDSSVTAANGIRIAAGAERIVDSRGDVYAIASAASTDVRFWEIYR